MTIQRRRHWSHPFGNTPEEISEWIYRHYQDHTEESAARIEDITNEVSITDFNNLANTSLADPGADRIVFWDDSDTQYEWLVPNAGISISVNNLDVDHDAANNFVANEHIDWTGTSNNLITSGTVRADNVDIYDTNASHFLRLDWNEDDSADRVLALFVNGAGRNVSLSGNLTVEATSIVNQDLSSDASVTFGTALLASIKSGATQAAAGAAANELWKTSSHATLPDNVVMIGV